MSTDTSNNRKAALRYHEFPKPGKISVNATKPLISQRDLALAYTPGVAAACEEMKITRLTAARRAASSVRRVSPTLDSRSLSTVTARVAPAA